MAAETTDDLDRTAEAIDGADVEELQAQVELLQAENQALRDDRAHRRRTRYRRSAAGLATVGVVAAAAALVFPEARNVLFALAGTGLFAGLLTYYLTPERFVAADVGAAAYQAHADAVDALTDELGLTDARIYIPRDVETDLARLFIPQHTDYVIPESTDLEPAFVVTDDPDERGISLPPTGVPLIRELRRTLSGPLAEEPTTLADQLADGIVEAFELADRATPDVTTHEQGGQVTIGVAEATFNDITRVDHPVASLFAVGLAVGLGQPITLEIAIAEDERAEYLITCRWSAAADPRTGDTDQERNT